MDTVANQKKTAHLWHCFHKFRFCQPKKFFSGGPFRPVGGGVAFAPIAPPPAYAPEMDDTNLNCNF